MLNYTRILIASMVILAGTSAASSQTVKPKKLLVVTTTAGFRHDIDTVETELASIARESGLFTLDFLHQPPGRPEAPKAVPPLKAGATAEEKKAFDDATWEYKAADSVFQANDAIWYVTSLKKALEKLSPAALAQYDGIIFASTTGELPMPDRPGFLNWIRSGKAFIGIHAATDTLFGWPEYQDMIGGTFKMHGPQVGVDVLNVDPRHPANRKLPAVWKIDLEEVYQFMNYDPSRVHELLALDKHPNDKTPGHYPLAWCRDYGKGRVFYTALGHRADMWNTDPTLKDRKNPPETAKAYREHLLGGILWALGIAK